MKMSTSWKKHPKCLTLLKQEKKSALLGLPTIADDSGLCVDCLNQAPGLYSARYAKENATTNENIQKVLNSIILQNCKLKKELKCFFKN
jgi:inosine/xanthosine triphosphate pyrophosphatase family protein